MWGRTEVLVLDWKGLYANPSLPQTSCCGQRGMLSDTQIMCEAKRQGLWNSHAKTAAMECIQ